MLAQEDEREAKELEISSLREQLRALQDRDGSSSSHMSDRRDSISVHEEVTRSIHGTETTGSSHGRKGKAPPVDAFTGESPDVLWEDWIPTLERAAIWNGWSDEEKLLQLAGHLHGKAQQEWALLPGHQKATFAEATQSLKSRLDLGGQMLAAQYF